MDTLGRDELLYLLSNHLHDAPCAIAALSRVCRALRDAASEPALWSQLLAASFWDAGLSPLRIPSLRWTQEEDDNPEQSIRAARALSPQQLFARYFSPVGREAIAALCGLPEGVPEPEPASAPPVARGKRRAACRLCDDTLLRRGRDHTGGQRRCPCVAARGAQLPLRLFSLSPARSRGSSLDTLQTFSEMRATLEELFELTVVTADRIEPASLSGVDMVILCTTEGEGLSEEEQAQLHCYVHAGGTAVVSAFTNWSARHHYNRALYAWLGVDSAEGGQFGQRQEYSLEGAAADWLRDHSVWGSASCLQFVNTGETAFQLEAQAEDGQEGDHGGIPLHGTAERTTLAVFPRQVDRGDSDGEPAAAAAAAAAAAGGSGGSQQLPPPSPPQGESSQGGEQEGRRRLIPQRGPRTIAVNLRLPAGAAPGMQMQVQAPFGVVAVTVPDGARGGQVIRLRVPVPEGQLPPVVAAAAPAGMRRGQVLVLSNLHCWADRGAWNGAQPFRPCLYNLFSLFLLV